MAEPAPPAPAARILEALPVGVLQLDSGRDIAYRNERLTELTGVAVATIDVLLTAVEPADRAAFERALADVVGDRRGGNIEVGYRHPDGQPRQWAVSLRALPPGPDGAGGSAVLCIADVTTAGTAESAQPDADATFDALTRCYSRTSILAALERLLDAGRGGPGVGLIFVDLDRFKEVNDSLGHTAGDRLLVQVAERLMTAARDSDLVGRLGGDEFLVVCPGVAGAAEALRIGERIAFVLGSARVEVGGEWVLPRVSIGVAWSPPASCSADALVGRADTAMHESRRRRRGDRTAAKH